MAIEHVTAPVLTDETGLKIVEAIEGIAKPDASDISTTAIAGQPTVEDALGYLDDKIDEAEQGNVKSVNAIKPDAQGEVRLVKVPYADNLTSDKTQNSEGEFVIRTAGGDASITDGDAFAIRVYGNRVHTGQVPEELNMSLTLAPRVAPDPITAELDEATFEAYVEESGIYTLTYDGSDWDNDPTDYGVTITGDPLSGDFITIVWDGENDAIMTVTAPRVAPDVITAYLNRDTFVAYVTESGTTTLSYTSAWDKNPATYGVTVSGTPVSGDTITITYVKEDRGTISVTTPTALKSTGWNLYNHTAGYAYLTKYSSEYGFYIGGNYTALQYSATISGAKSTIVPVDRVFTIPDDGYVWVTGGNSTSTYIINQWSDWTDGSPMDFEAYSETTIDISSVMTSYFPNGLFRVGTVRDEINLNSAQAISKIQRLAYNAENLALAQASGRPYEYDTNYIYLVKATYESNAITVDGSYTASDHGNEFFTGTTVPAYLETMYGNNLKNKLERDVVTISQQTLTSSQQTQVRSNLNAASKDEVKPIVITLDNVSGANGNYSHTTSSSLVSEDMKAVDIDVGTPETFKAPITITTGNGTVTLTCPNAVGSSTVQVTMIRTQPVDVGTSYPSVTSTEFDILSGRIGSLSTLATSVKTDLVSAVNSLNSKITYSITDMTTSDPIQVIKNNIATIVAMTDLRTLKIHTSQLQYIAVCDTFSGSVLSEAYNSFYITGYDGYCHHLYRNNGNWTDNDIGSLNSSKQNKVKNSSYNGTTDGDGRLILDVTGRIPICVYNANDTSPRFAYLNWGEKLVIFAPREPNSQIAGSYYYFE